MTPVFTAKLAASAACNCKQHTAKGQKGDGVRRIASGFPAFCSDARWSRYLLGLIIIGEDGGAGELNDNIATSVQTSLRPGLDCRTRTATGLDILLGEEGERPQSELFMKRIH